MLLLERSDVLSHMNSTFKLNNKSSPHIVFLFIEAKHSIIHSWEANANTIFYA